jgi:hypothetical protein
VTVETEFHRIREVRADLQERGTPFAIVDVEIVVIDGDRLAGEIKYGGMAAARPFVRFEGPHLFLRHADQHDTVAAREACAVGRDKRVLAVNAFEGNKWHVSIGRESLDGGDQAIVSRLEQRGRRHRMTQVVVEEIAETAGCLQLGHVGVQIQAIDTADLE